MPWLPVAVMLMGGRAIITGAGRSHVESPCMSYADSSFMSGMAPSEENSEALEGFFEVV